jgi:hypothetical protein|nr:MAG TPA: Protein of unknown function (DUF551) [Caudoviricetes sp.]
MKQTVEKAAKENILFNHRTVDRTLIGKDLAKFGEMNFVQGAEWQSKQSLWISVKERLPEEGQKVFVLTMCCGVSRILIERFYKTSAFDKDNRWVFGNSIVLAWMPIPSFDDILEANRDVLERIKKKGD